MVSSKKIGLAGKVSAETAAKFEEAAKKKEPLWRGPSVDGITFSLLNRFLACRERFRILVIEGLKPADEFNQALEYGNMWHTCEEAHANTPEKEKAAIEWAHKEGWKCTKGWQVELEKYSRDVKKRYPTQQETVYHWQELCKVQFALYEDYWSQHPDMLRREALLSEYEFAIPYELPSGRIVILRGKWDSVDVVRSGGDHIWLHENKSKGKIDERRLVRQLTFDLQTMFYLTTLQIHKKNFGKSAGIPIAGVRYNVIRRPKSGLGPRDLLKATKKTPAETLPQFHQRVGEYITEDPKLWFYRWNILVAPHEIEKFRRTCLDPILEQLCDWWTWIEYCTKEGISPFDTSRWLGLRLPGESSNGERSFQSSLHWTAPFGTYNPLEDGGASDLDAYIATGNTVGLQRTDNLFPELKVQLPQTES